VQTCRASNHYHAVPQLRTSYNDGVDLVSIVGLFAGIGGLELGFAAAGLETSVLAEIDPAASAILKVRFPDAEIFGDVADLTSLPDDTSILTAGFPCQNLSMAGDKTGIDGKKSGVVSVLFALIERSKVPTIVIENVYFMLQLDRGRALDSLATRLEALNYAWAYRVLDTIGFGLPQRRRRVYLVASRVLDPRSVLFADETPRRQARKPTLEHSLGFYWTEGRSGVGITLDGIPPIKGGSGVGIPSAPAVLFQDGAVLMPSLSACERLQGFRSGWTSVSEARLGRSPEWRLIGNAVSVPVAAWVASRLTKPAEPLQLDTRPLEPGARWPDAAFNVAGKRIAIDASDKPICRQTQSIDEFRDASWFQLSDRALDGFLRRAVEGNLRFPTGFIDAIRQAERRKPIAA
jgi:DNA (cytosine-5)-methyltransferase 1